MSSVTLPFKLCYIEYDSEVEQGWAYFTDQEVKLISSPPTVEQIKKKIPFEGKYVLVQDKFPNASILDMNSGLLPWMIFEGDGPMDSRFLNSGTGIPTLAKFLKESNGIIYYEERAGKKRPKKESVPEEKLKVEPLQEKLEITSSVIRTKKKK